jgi:hypothetical protein
MNKTLATKLAKMLRAGEIDGVKHGHLSFGDREACRIAGLALNSDRVLEIMSFELKRQKAHREGKK